MTHLATLLARFRASRWAGLEPWYDWGTINTFRMGLGPESEGDVWFFEIQWFGVHLGVEIGRTPKERNHG